MQKIYKDKIEWRKAVFNQYPNAIIANVKGAYTEALNEESECVGNWSIIRGSGWVKVKEEKTI